MGINQEGDGAFLLHLVIARAEKKPPLLTGNQVAGKAPDARREGNLRTGGITQSRVASWNSSQPSRQGGAQAGSDGRSAGRDAAIEETGRSSRRKTVWQSTKNIQMWVCGGQGCKR